MLPRRFIISWSKLVTFFANFLTFVLYISVEEGHGESLTRRAQTSHVTTRVHEHSESAGTPLSRPPGKVGGCGVYKLRPIWQYGGFWSYPMGIQSSLFLGPHQWEHSGVSFFCSSFGAPQIRLVRSSSSLLPSPRTGCLDYHVVI